MKNPTCSVCQLAYNEGERTPMLLHCGQGFCQDCLTRLFAASSDHSLSCPWCRHPTTVGNSVETLKKNFLVLSLIHDGHNFSDEEDLSPEKAVEGARRWSFEREPIAASSSSYAFSGQRGRVATPSSSQAPPAAPTCNQATPVAP
ncbi:hypothetical protein AMTR_s01384p00009170, partial [Amborella trichopoda]